jgi:hypothetical protein
MLNKVETPKQDGRLEYSEFLDKVAERVVDRAKEREIPGMYRLANVWRLNGAEASITQSPTSSDLLVTFRCGPDASRFSYYKPDTVDSTADAIIDRLDWLRHTALQ